MHDVEKSRLHSSIRNVPQSEGQLKSDSDVRIPGQLQQGVPHLRRSCLMKLCQPKRILTHSWAGIIQGRDDGGWGKELYPLERPQGVQSSYGRLALPEEPLQKGNGTLVLPLDQEPLGRDRLIPARYL